MSGRLLLEVNAEAAASTTRLLGAAAPSEEVELRLSETLGFDEDIGEAAPLTPVVTGVALNEGPGATPTTAPFSLTFDPRGRLFPVEEEAELSSFNLT